MSRLSPSRAVLSLGLACALGVLPACGGSEVDPDEGALGSTVSASPTTHPAKPSKKPKKSKKPKPTPTRSEDGDGDSIGDDAPVTAGGGVCAEISPSDVADVVGGEVKGSGLSGGGCLFSQSDRRAPETTIKDEKYAGMDAAKTEATSAVEGDPENLAGIGRGAFVVTGTIFGGTDINGAGAVHVGSRTISVLVVQHKGLSRAKVRSLVVELLQLVARAAG